jgi:hypothetical protein
MQSFRKCISILLFLGFGIISEAEIKTIASPTNTKPKQLMFTETI